MTYTEMDGLLFDRAMWISLTAIAVMGVSYLVWRCAQRRAARKGAGAP